MRDIEPGDVLVVGHGDSLEGRLFAAMRGPGMAVHQSGSLIVCIDLSTGQEVVVDANREVNFEDTRTVWRAMGRWEEHDLQRGRALLRGEDDDQRGL
jgi:hypothetical protein